MDPSGNVPKIDSPYGPTVAEAVAAAHSNSLTSDAYGNMVIGSTPASSPATVDQELRDQLNGTTGSGDAGSDGNEKQEKHRDRRERVQVGPSLVQEDTCRLWPCFGENGTYLEQRAAGFALGMDVLALGISAGRETVAGLGCLAGAGFGGSLGSLLGIEGTAGGGIGGCAGGYGIASIATESWDVVEMVVSFAGFSAVAFADLAGDRTGFDRDSHDTTFVVGGDTIVAGWMAAYGAYTPDPTIDLVINVELVAYDMARHYDIVPDWEFAAGYSYLYAGRSPNE